MRCPACGHPDDRVVDSRSAHNDTAIRRRRECLSCLLRFTTYERVEETITMIVKRDSRREVYSREKLLKGLRIACRKRTISAIQIESLADQVEGVLLASGKREVSSRMIGDQVMKGLSEVDKVAYIRFASVYQSFEDIDSFSKLLLSMNSDDYEDELE